MANEKRILVVEDDDAIRALLFTVLRRRGFRVDCATNGASALERLNSCLYTVVLLDLMMPVMDGYEFLDQLDRRKLAAPPLIIVLTAGGAARNLNPNIVAGTIRKPFNVELLIDTVTACMATREELSQHESCPEPESHPSGSSTPGPSNESN